MAHDKRKPAAPTLAEIKRANAAAGGHWFEPGAMRFFNSRILPGVYAGKGGVYFVTSETPDPQRDPRRFSVRKVLKGGKAIDTAGEFQAYGSHEAAREAAKQLAAGEMELPTRNGSGPAPSVETAPKRKKAEARARKKPAAKTGKRAGKKAANAPAPEPVGLIDTTPERRAAQALREMVGALNRAESVASCDEVWAALLDAYHHREAARAHLLSISPGLAPRAKGLLETLEQADERANEIVETIGWCKGTGGKR